MIIMIIIILILIIIIIIIIILTLLILGVIVKPIILRFADSFLRLRARGRCHPAAVAQFHRTSAQRTQRIRMAAVRY
jgi:hypothetical protein